MQGPRLIATLRLRLRRLVFVAAAIFVAASLSACSAGESGDHESAAPPVSAGDAQALTSEFLTLLRAKDTAGLNSFLSDAFILQRADGSSATKADYLTRLPEIGEFSITNLTFRQSGTSLVVRWDLTVVETINGQPYRSTPAPRLSTFAYEGGDWRMTSHANFNAPLAAPAN